MAVMKLVNWTAAANTAANPFWPGVIADDKYSETFSFASGGSTTENFANMVAAGAPENCTTAETFIRVFKVQPSTHRMIIQLHLTTATAAVQEWKLGVFGTIDEATENALWARVPDSTIGATLHNLAGGQTAQAAITYNPFSVLTGKLESDVDIGEYYEVGKPMDTDLEATTDDMLWGFDLDEDTGVATVGSYAQYVLGPEQLCYDYIAIRISGRDTQAQTSGAMKFLVKQFN